MTRAPHTYAEWAAVLDAFGNKANDAEIIPAMHQGTLDWQAGVSERFSKRLVDAVNKRMNAAIDRFSREQKKGNGDERQLIVALHALRKEFVTLINAMDIQALPQEFRGRYAQLIVDQANSVQRSLEQSASTADRSGRMLATIRNTPVNKF